MACAGGVTVICLFFFDILHVASTLNSHSGTMVMSRTISVITFFLLHSASLIAGTNEAVSSETNDAVYLHEGFNSLSLPAGWNVRRISGTLANWNFVGQGSNPTVNPFAGTGQAKFNSFDASSGEQSRLTSPGLFLPSSADAFLTFSMYHDDEYIARYDSVYVEATTGDSIAGPWTVLLALRRSSVTNGWKRERVTLFPFGGNRIFLSLRSVSGYGNNIYIDEFRVADSSFHDLGMVKLFSPLTPSPPTVAQEAPVRTSPRSGGKGDKEEPRSSGVLLRPPFTLKTVVRNYGTFNEPSYQVPWLINGQRQPSSAGRPLLARFGLDTVTLSWQNPTAGLHTFTAWTSLSSDRNPDNDTMHATLLVLDTATVFYESFDGPFPPAGWTVINRDGGSLAPWFRGADTSAFLPLEGTGFAANNFQRANGAYLDDYLITPPIAGVGQANRLDSVVFWVRSHSSRPPAVNYPDSLMILISTSGADTSSFSIVLEYFAVPKTGWTRKAYGLNLPSNSTVRVAFRYLLYRSGLGNPNGDFVGIDGFQLTRRTPTSVPLAANHPDDFVLHQNFPNPFNPTTKMSFVIGHSSLVSLKVFDLLGGEVAVLVNEQKGTGSYTVEWNAEKMASGIYFYRLNAGGFTAIKKMLLLR